MNERALTVDRTRIWANAAKSDTSDGNDYKGLQAHSRAGLHAHVAGLVSAHVPDGSTVLDIAAGSGAFCLRLSDAGYRMSATDYVGTNFRLHGQIPFNACDLNTDFSAHLGKFEAITAMEIVEHLENPHHFLRELRKMLPTGGTLILSSPNPNSSASKTEFARSGEFVWFRRDDYRVQGHISPISVNNVPLIAEQAQFEVVDLSTFGDSLEHYAQSPRQRILAQVMSLMDSSPKHLRGDIWIAVLRAV